MSGYWSVTNRAATGNATATQSAPTSGLAGGGLSRVRAIQASSAVALELTVTDSISGVLMSIDVTAAGPPISLTNIDLRGSVGGNLTFAWNGTNTTGATDVNAQGDFVPSGYPMFQS